MKVVIDTNVLISGIFWSGDSHKVLCSWRDRKFEMITSMGIILEFVKVLRDFKIKMPEETIKEWVELIVQNSVMVEPKEEVFVVKEDPKDDMFISTAIEGDVDYIISQDNHLLKIKEFKGIKMVTPEEFNEICD